MAVHNDQCVHGAAPDDAQAPDGDRSYQGDRVRQELRRLVEAAVAQRLGMPGDTRTLSPRPPPSAAPRTAASWFQP
ncbi:polyprenyl diphosphate synthase [Streptomyces sp. NBRC 110611]|nr:polyprenyl diphosphate synthase [Streptomyces sp. NBRC 110611]